MILNVGNAADYIRQQIEKLPHGFSHACLKVLNNKQFRLWPAAVAKHQPYPGGLCLHTAEVLQIALATASASCIKLNETVLITAAIFHDYGKLWDMAVKDKDKYFQIETNWDINRTIMFADAAIVWEKVPHRYLVRHVARSYSEWMIESTAQGIGDPMQLDIAHAIGAHHGKLEWNALAEPQTIEAQILFHSDLISARYPTTAPLGS